MHNANSMQSSYCENCKIWNFSKYKKDFWRLAKSPFIQTFISGFLLTDYLTYMLLALGL